MQGISANITKSATTHRRHTRLCLFTCPICRGSGGPPGPLWLHSSNVSSSSWSFPLLMGPPWQTELMSRNVAAERACVRSWRHVYPERMLRVFDMGRRFADAVQTGKRESRKCRVSFLLRFQMRFLFCWAVQYSCIYILATSVLLSYFIVFSV